MWWGRSRRGRGRALWLAAVVAVPLAGCFNPFDPRVIQGGGIAEPPPAPDSPGGVLRLLQWCYEHRNSDLYRELFTADYRFVFSQLDKAGEPYRDEWWTREDEVESTINLFQGGSANQPAATSIEMRLDRNFLVSDDPRFPGQGRIRKQIRTSVALTIVDINQAQTNVNGYAVFSLARGDVAEIPEDLEERGFGPDSTRWYIERHEDLTAQPGGTRAMPLAASWGYVKAAYR